ncbi:MAG: DUF6084 family protein [Solirubrobacteraceae bacterium]
MSAATPGRFVDATPIPELDFAIQEAGPLEYAAAPTLRFGLAIESVRGDPIRSVVLDVQVQIAARRRAYDDATEERLYELFGEPERWGSTLRTLPWSRVTVAVPPFTGTTSIDLPVSCTYDFEVAASRYLNALEDGEVPLEFLFGGTVFYADAGGLLKTARISWDKEAEYRLPAAVWRDTMDHYFPNSAWLRLRKDSFDRLYAYKARNALPGWEEAVDSLLRGSEGT